MSLEVAFVVLLARAGSSWRGMILGCIGYAKDAKGRKGRKGKQKPKYGFEPIAFAVFASFANFASFASPIRFLRELGGRLMRVTERAHAA